MDPLLLLLPADPADHFPLSPAEEEAFYLWYSAQWQAFFHQREEGSLQSLPARFQLVEETLPNFYSLLPQKKDDRQVAHWKDYLSEGRFHHIQKDFHPFISGWITKELEWVAAVKPVYSFAPASIWELRETLAYYGQAMDQMLHLYEEVVQAGLQRLKNIFQRSFSPANPHWKMALHREQHWVLSLLQGETGLKPKVLAKRWRIKEKQARQFLRELERLMQDPNYTLNLLNHRSPGELKARAHGPLLEPEAWILYGKWLMDLPQPDTGTSQVSGLVAPIDWQGPGGAASLEILFGEGKRAGWWEAGWEEFLAHFEQSNAKPIRWEGSLVLLIYLFQRLGEQNFLPHIWEKKLPSMLADHFLDKSGQPLKPTSITASKSRSLDPPRGSEEVERILKLLGQTASSENV